MGEVRSRVPVGHNVFPPGSWGWVLASMMETLVKKEAGFCKNKASASMVWMPGLSRRFLECG